MENKENLHREEEAANGDMVANSLRARGHRRQNESTKRVNKLWLWLGVLLLVAILLYWLFSIGIMESLSGYFNGN
ncbi:MAG: hypothetical protein K2J48_09420 [Muribaculaceae bacterium]|nr:hypothetical protein [Muribaculaceae bacterium]MDE6008418.1 hypothetical protein [Muribaculaceae bacterium]MDE6793290.1 hypothetical protein [Muribaculaceae bacterium]